jgi:hypothetical protein
MVRAEIDKHQCTIPGLSSFSLPVKAEECPPIIFTYASFIGINSTFCFNELYGKYALNHISFGKRLDIRIKHLTKLR